MQNSTSFRALAPASSAASPTSNPERTEPTTSKGQSASSSALPKKRSPVPVACNNCQKRKSKCSGQRPTCSSCEAKGLDCHYDVKDSVQVLRNTAQELSNKLQDYEKLFAHIRASSDINDIHEILDTFKSSPGWGRRDSTFDEQSQPGSVDTTPSLVLSPSTPSSSSFSQSSLGQWPSGGLRSNSSSAGMHFDSAIFQEKGSTNIHLELFGHIPLSCSSLVTQYHVSADRAEAARVLVPEYLIQPLWSSEQSLLSKVYTEYRDAARRLIASGTPVEQILGPDFVSVDLFFRDRLPTDGFTVSSWACEVSKGFYMIDVHVRLALAVLFTYLMRWMLDPTIESYNRVPEIIRPTPAQKLIPHAPMIDLAITAPVREALCRKARDWSSMMEKYIRFNWPYHLDDCFEYDPTTGRNTRLTTSFEEYASDVKNWSFEASILEECPELIGQVPIYTQPFDIAKR